MELRPSPVKEASRSAGLEVLQPEKARAPELHDRLEEIAPDAAVVVAYGKILPKGLLEIPRLGFVNVHFSLLPRYRGAAPVQRAVMDGVTETGVSIMVLTEGMDEGPILAEERIPVGESDTAGEVGGRLAEIGANALVRELLDYEAGRIHPVEQDHARATYAPKIDESEARIDWSRATDAIRNHVRGLNPVPGAWTTLRGARLKVHSVIPAEASTGLPGTMSESPAGLVATTGDGGLLLAAVQPATKSRMSGSELARGLRLIPGERLE
jgi:methionyl-tRNA formyltransferase